MPIEPEGLHRKALSRLNNCGRFKHNTTHELQGLDEIGFAAGVGTINDSAAQQQGGGSHAGGQGVAVLQGLVTGGDKAQYLLVTQAAKVLHAELYQHGIFPDR